MTDIPDKDTRAEWREEAKNAIRCTLWEYCPPEFEVLLYAVERLAQEETDSPVVKELQAIADEAQALGDDETLYENVAFWSLAERVRAVLRTMGIEAPEPQPRHDAAEEEEP